MTTLRSGQRTAARSLWTNAALVVIGFALLLLTRQLTSEYDHFTIGFSVVAGWSVFFYALAVLLILSQPVNRYTFGIILFFAVACRLVTLFPEPYLSSDIYRYAWDGVVQHAHISPYRYAPGDPALTFLRQPNQELFDNINRREYAHTIYPPGAQMLFYLITFLNPTVTFMKLAMILLEGVTMYGLVLLLKEFGLRREQCMVYAWCPLVIWEIGSSGHVDSAVMACILMALLARYRGQPIRTGLFLGLAIMIKFYPLVLLPALFRRGEYRMLAATATVIAVGYACYASVGLKVFGFLGGYVQEEGMRAGTRYYLLELAQHAPGLRALPTSIYLAFAAAMFGLLITWCWRTCCNPAWHGGARAQSRLFDLPAKARFLLPAFALAFAMMLLFSPHYPWYVAWLVPFLTLVPDLTIFTYVCGLFYLCSTDLAVGTGPKQFLLNTILYSGVLAALLLDTGLRLWTIRRHGPHLKLQSDLG